MKAQKFISPLFAVLLITSGIASIGTQNVSAIHECGSTDMAVYGFSFGFVNDNKCGESHYDDAIREMEESDASQEKVDIYQAGASITANKEVTNSIFDNYLNDTRTTAWSKAEQAIAEAHKNGLTKAEAKVQAKEAISNYYAVKQVNLIEKQNVTVSEITTLQETAEMEEGIDDQYVDFHAQVFGDKHLEAGEDKNYIVGSNVTSTNLVNGSTHYMTGLEVRLEINEGFNTKYTNNVNFYPNRAYPVGNPDQTFESASGYSLNDSYHAFTHPVNENYENQSIWSPSYNIDRWNQIEQLNSELQSESENFVEGIWTDLEQGNINSSDVISRTTLMFEYGTDAQNGSYHDMIGATASMGLDSPDLNNTGTMTIQYQNSEYEGMLFGEPPNSSWQVDEEYNSDDFNSPVLMATTSGELIEIDGTFTLTSAVTKDGTEQDSVSTTEYNYQTADTQEMTELMDEMENLRQEVENREPDAGGGGSNDDNSTNLPSWLTEKYAGVPLWGIIAGVLAIGTLLTNRN